MPSDAGRVAGRLVSRYEQGEKRRDITMHYDTALRGYTSKRVEKIESADILVGYNNERTIAHVIQMSQPRLAPDERVKAKCYTEK